MDKRPGPQLAWTLDGRNEAQITAIARGEHCFQ